MEKASINTLKRLAQIGDRKYHTRHNEFLIEGVRLIEEAFRAGAPVKEIAVAIGSERKGRIKALINAALANNLPVWQLNAHEMERISRTENNQGIAAGVALPEKLSGDIFGELLQIKKGIILLLDGLQDPGNMGTLIRTAEAFVVNGVILGPGSAGLYNPKTLRSTMGAIFRMPVAEMHDRSITEIVQKFRENAFQIVAADANENSTKLEKGSFEHKVLLIIGQEASGISEGVLDIADIKVAVEMLGPTESLNAAVAGGIIIHHIARELQKR